MRALSIEHDIKCRSLEWEIYSIRCQRHRHNIFYPVDLTQRLDFIEIDRLRKDLTFSFSVVCVSIKASGVVWHTVRCQLYRRNIFFPFSISTKIRFHNDRYKEEGSLLRAACPMETYKRRSLLLGNR
jgi:hypothetical protein